MPGFYGGIPRVKEVYLQHYWYADQIGPIQLAGSDSLILQDVGLPNFEPEVHTQPGASLMYKFASHVKYTDATITFYDTQGLIKSIENWREKIWTKGEGVQPKNQYARETIICQTQQH